MNKNKNKKKLTFLQIERLLGEIFVVVGVFVIFCYELFVFVKYLTSDSFHFETSLISILFIVIGLAILIVSVFREQIFVSNHQRYKDVDK